jgi:phospholipase C
MQKALATSMAALMVATQILAPAAVQAQPNGSTATPIKHVVVIFGENISFDHYFGTYPNATNPRNEPRFVAAPNTPSVNGYTAALLSSNPNLLNKAGNAGGASNPFRLDRSQASTADQDHDYTPEQQAFHGGLMDSFPEFTGTPGPPPTGQATTGLVMGYYDGNTVTALWNYAQRFAMNDNSYDTNFGPSSPGAINLISGQTNGVTDQSNATGDVIEDGDGGFTLVSDADPIGDLCSTTTGAAECARPHLGLLRGRLQPEHEESRRQHRLRAVAHLGCYKNPEGRLHPASRALPVLSVHRQSEAPAAILEVDDRTDGPGQSPVRHG